MYCRLIIIYHVFKVKCRNETSVESLSLSPLVSFISRLLLSFPRLYLNASTFVIFVTYKHLIVSAIKDLLNHDVITFVTIDCSVCSYYFIVAKQPRFCKLQIIFR